MVSKLRFGLLGLALLGCASASRFPLKAPLTRDADQTPFAAMPEEGFLRFRPVQVAWQEAALVDIHPGDT